MLTADQITALGDKAQRITDPIVEFLIEDIARRVSEAGQLTSTASYQVWRLQQLGMSQQEVQREIRKRLGVSQKEVEQLLTQAAEVGYDFDLSRLPHADAVSFADNETVQQIVSSGVQMAQEDLSNMVGTLGFVNHDGVSRPLTEAYQQVCDFAFQKVAMGAQDYNSAIRQATKGLAERGIVSIDYESGVSTSIEAAVRRNLMSALGTMQEQISQQTHDDLGCDGWEISAHGASAPDHEPFQGKQYSDARYKELNNDLVRRIGTLNCGHAAFPIILGVNEPQYSAAELEQFRQANEKGIDYEGKHYTMYEATQRQRKLERAIRNRKRRILIDQTTGDEQRLAIDQTRLVILNDEYARFSKAAGLRSQRERMNVAGFGVKEAREAEKGAKSMKKEKLTVALSPENDKIGLYRRDGNPGSFRCLPERMSKKHIRSVAAEYGIDLKGLNLNIDMNEDLLRIPYTGRADPEHIGGITFFPNAFKSKEDLLRTLYHEKIHVQQFREFGAEYVQNNRAHFEQLAYAAEDEFITTLKERGLI